MGLVLIPSEVVQKADILKNFLNNNIENYRKALQLIQNFSDSKELDTVAYDKLKSQISEYHQPIVQGMAAAEDSILEAAESLKQSVGSEELDEEELKDTIDKLKDEQEKIREQIKEYQLLRSRVFYFSWGLACNPINGEIASLQEELEKNQQVLDEVQKKLDTLTEINDSTASLFDDALNIFLAIEAALYDAGVEIPDAEERFKELDWREKLSTEHTKMDEKIRLFIEEALEAELQIDLDELIELYGDDVVERMIEIVNENGIDRFGEGNAEKVIGAVMEGLTGYQVTKEDGEYKYVDKDGTNTVLTTEIANELLKKQAELNQVIKAALSQNGTKEVGDNHTEYSEWYFGDGRSAAWCAIFVLWCMNKANLLDGELLPVQKEIDGNKGVYDEKGNHLSVVHNLKNWYKDHDKYVDAKSGYEPKAGDLFFHDSGEGKGHTGIILAYDKENQIVYTIEGNSGNQVAIRDYKYNGSYIDGYCINEGNLFGTIPEESGGETTSDR